MRGNRPRRHAVQLDLYSPVDESGNLITGQDGTPLMNDKSSGEGPAGVSEPTRPDTFMCGQRFIETGWPWA